MIYSNLKWTIRLLLFKILNFVRVRKGKWIMGRVACLGQDIFTLMRLNIPLVNIQKGRVDYLNDVFKNQINKTKANHVIPFIGRDDIKDLILQQENVYSFKKNPCALYMDSFSELTDQRFFNTKLKWSFCANYSDITHSTKFNSEFYSAGPLDLEDLIEQYRIFFSSFRSKCGSIPIIFIHFPVKLDKREKFKMRALKIKKAIDFLKNDFQPFYSFEVDEDIVDWPNNQFSETGQFPYHYNQKTYQNFADQLSSLNLLKN